MKKIIFIAIIIFGCNNVSQKNPIPKNLISEEKMIDVIYEMTLISVSKGVNRRVLENNGVVPEKYIFNKYNIDSLQFALSNQFYSNHLETYLRIYNRVKEKLEENKEIISDSIEIYKKTNAKRSLDIKEMKNFKIVDSIKKNRSRTPLKKDN
tara:strand:- start:1073 stop:1528 length:456 start_codon:yes stop_codon:yes gene_type:complete